MKTEADGYRLNNKKMDGFVVFTKEGILSGWCKTLDDASSWKPGVRAIGINGDEYISWGGDDQNGAEGWKQVMKSRGRPKKVDAMSNAEKQKAYRDRQRTLHYQMLVNPPVDKQLEAEVAMNKKLAQSTAQQNTRLVEENAKLKEELDQAKKWMAAMADAACKREEKESAKRSNVTKKAVSNDAAFDALANKLAMTERALLSSQGEVKRLYEEIEELQREVVKLSKKHQKGYL